MAIAKNAQLERLILLAKNCVIVVQLQERALRRAANPNDTMSSAISTNLRARKPILRMISAMLEPIFLNLRSAEGIKIRLDRPYFKGSLETKLRRSGLHMWLTILR